MKRMVVLGVALLATITASTLAPVQPSQANRSKHSMVSATGSLGGTAPSLRTTSLAPSPGDPSLIGKVGARQDLPTLRGPTAGLSDIGPNSVIGPDDRTRVSPTTSYPSSAVVFLIVDPPGSGPNGTCTGFLVSVDLVVTAGHCVYNHDTTAGPVGWMDFIGFVAVPGQDRSDLPFGFCGASDFYTVDGWIEDAAIEYDYGAIKLDCNVGAATGTFGLTATSGSVNGEATILRGYPGDKYDPELFDGTMWTTTKTITTSTEGRLGYEHDTRNGQSGSPVFTTCPSGDKFCAIAIHAYGVGAGGWNVNGGTRIRQAVYENYMVWIAD